MPWIGRNHASAPRDATHLSPVAQYGGKGMSAAPGMTADLWMREKDLLARSNPTVHPALTGLPGQPGMGYAASLQQYYTAEQAQTAALLQQQQYQIQQLQAQVAARNSPQWTGAPPAQMPMHMSNGHAQWGYGAQPHTMAQAPTHAHHASNGNAQSPVDVHAFAQNKGFNPPPHLVDLQPENARFFVIKVCSLQPLLVVHPSNEHTVVY